MPEISLVLRSRRLPILPQTLIPDPESLDSDPYISPYYRILIHLIFPTYPHNWVVGKEMKLSYYDKETDPSIYCYSPDMITCFLFLKQQPR